MDTLKRPFYFTGRTDGQKLILWVNYTISYFKKSFDPQEGVAHRCAVSRCAGQQWAYKYAYESPTKLRDPSEGLKDRYGGIYRFAGSSYRFGRCCSSATRRANVVGAVYLERIVNATSSC